MTAIEIITKLLVAKRQEIISEWVDLLKKVGGLETGRINESELTVQCHDFLGLFGDAVQKGASMSPIRPTRKCAIFLAVLPARAPCKDFTQRDRDIRIFAEGAFVQYTEP
jgi:hypothetical protein